MMMLQHIYRHIVRNVLSNTYHSRWISREVPIAWPPQSTELLYIIWIFTCGVPKSPCVCSFCWQQRGTSPSHCGCLSDYPQLPRHLWTDMAVHDETCWGMHWISWRTFWALIINILIQLLTTYKFWTHVCVDSFLFWYFEHIPKMCRKLSFTLCIKMACS
jgi:hypothetical protein